MLYCIISTVVFCIITSQVSHLVLICSQLVHVSRSSPDCCSLCQQLFKLKLISTFCSEYSDHLGWFSSRSKLLHLNKFLVLTRQTLKVLEWLTEISLTVSTLNTWELSRRWWQWVRGTKRGLQDDVSTDTVRGVEERVQGEDLHHGHAGVQAPLQGDHWTDAGLQSPGHCCSVGHWPHHVWCQGTGGSRWTRVYHFMKYLIFSCCTCAGKVWGTLYALRKQVVWSSISFDNVS